MSNGSVDFNLNYYPGNSEHLKGEHLFERAGLGKAPFVVKGYSAHKFQAMPGAPIQPGTSCCYCGTACIYVANLESADGKKFHVGLDCVEKTGDAGLARNIKRSPEYRAIQRQQRHALDERKAAEIEEILNRPEMAHHVGSFRYRLGWCGAAGRARILKELRELTTPESIA